MEYFINTGIWGAVFAVPNAVADNYLKLASGTAVKVLLYTLRNSGSTLSREKIASEINATPEDVADAFTFWQTVGIMSETAASVPVQPTALEEKAAPPLQNDEKAAKPKGSVLRSSAHYMVTPAEIGMRAEQSDDVKTMFDLAQTTMGGLLTPAEQRSLIWLHDYLGFTADVILMLLSYCVSQDKKSVGYIEKVALSWNEAGISTLDDAQAEISRLEEAKGYEARIIKVFGLQRPAPTSSQKAHIEKWQSSGFSVELLEYACEKAIDAGKTLTFGYVNGILNNWKNDNITTREQAVAAAKANYGKYYSKESAPQVEQSYNIDDLKKLAINYIEENE